MQHPSRLLLLAAGLVAATASAQPWNADRLKKEFSQSVISIEGNAELPSSAVESWSGTGFVVHAKGYVLTNAHVAKSETGYKAGSYKLMGRQGKVEGEQFRLEVIKRDDDLDIALLKFSSNLESLRALSIGDSNSVSLEDVYVMGFPRNQGLTVVKGSISDLHARHGRFLTSAPLNYGNSGGPVFNERSGEVIAMVVGGSPGQQGISYLIPINYARGLLRLLGQPW